MDAPEIVLVILPPLLHRHVVPHPLLKARGLVMALLQVGQGSRGRLVADHDELITCVLHGESRQFPGLPPEHDVVRLQPLTTCPLVKCQLLVLGDYLAGPVDAMIGELETTEADTVESLFQFSSA